VKLNRISPLDHDKVCEALGDRKYLLVLEDSFGAGCVGQRLAAILAEHGQAPEHLILKNLGKKFAPEGSVSQLEQRFGLDAGSVVSAVEEVLGHGK
jgi:1-deoxy-D-xylulose-5-phosphate synthase